MDPLTENQWQSLTPLAMQTLSVTANLLAMQTPSATANPSVMQSPRVMVNQLAMQTPSATANPLATRYRLALASVLGRTRGAHSRPLRIQLVDQH